MTEKLSHLDFLTPPMVREGSGHVYYLYPLKYHEEATGLTREEYINNVRELGVPLYRFAGGYIRPLYLEPVFAQRDRFKNGFPYSLHPEGERPRYGRGVCPVTERLYNKEMIVTAYNYPPLATSDMDDIVKAFAKAATMK